MYKFLKVIVKAIFFSLFRVKIIGKENLKFEGKMIIYSIHVAAIDPFFIHCMLDRMPRFMAKKEIFQNKLIAWVVTKLGAFPVDRDNADMNSIKTAFRVLNNGEILGIFPEGRRTTDGKMGKFLPGAAMIALRANAPMLPMYISRRMKPFCRTYFIVGKPFYIKDKLEDAKLSNPESVIDATDLIKGEVLKLKEQADKLCQK